MGRRGGKQLTQALLLHIGLGSMKAPSALIRYINSMETIYNITSITLQKILLL